MGAHKALIRASLWPICGPCNSLSLPQALSSRRQVCVGLPLDLFPNPAISSLGLPLYLISWSASLSHRLVCLSISSLGLPLYLFPNPAISSLGLPISSQTQLSHLFLNGSAPSLYWSASLSLLPVWSPGECCLADDCRWHTQNVTKPSPSSHSPVTGVIPVLSHSSSLLIVWGQKTSFSI